MSALKGRIKVGTRFVGNVNGVEFKVLKIYATRNGLNVAVVEESKTGKTFSYGVDALEHCYITILEE